MNLNRIFRLRLNDDDYLLFHELKRLRIKPTKFIRTAFREKIERELNVLIKEEQKRKSKKYIPF